MELKDGEAKQRAGRHAEMLEEGGDVVERLVLRSAVLSGLQASLDGRGFRQVETPVLWRSAGGATARPFDVLARYADGGDGVSGSRRRRNLQLRVAPELFLKQLVIGGMERVYEMGKQFRDEGSDMTHAPEFTTLELYQAYADYEDLMPLTEELLGSVQKGCRAVDGAPDFAKAPYARIDVVSELEKSVGAALPLDASAGAVDSLMAACREVGAKGDAGTPAQLWDRLIGHVLEPRCDEPTFLVHHPTVLSPLAREHPGRPGICERFELFVRGTELVNAYSELNDPAEQRARFEAQEADRVAGDAEAQGLNEMSAAFCDALEMGMPPTAGWGLGVDRLVMMLSGARAIRDVQTFTL